MFFFKNKGPKVRDVVYLNEAGWHKGIRLWMQDHTDGKVVVWFQQDLERLRAALHDVAEDRFVLTDRLGFGNVSDRAILFAGHYPLHKNETELADSLGIKELLIYSHLAMPLLRLFGSDRISEMMVKIGMKEDEPLNHSMITKAIENAQEKIAKGCVADLHANSEDEWMRMNAISGA